jgi:RNA polymerase sigma-70 factor (ECF subfamily)
MTPPTTNAGETARPRNYFPTTHWSVVLAAEQGDSEPALAALEKLCQSYWYPLYAYVRRRGHGPQDAEDLTQEFFARLLQHNWVALADRSKGRFRSFLLMVLNRFLAGEWDKIRAQKRGGGVRPVSLALETAETRYAREPATTTTPEQIFERQWALALLEQALDSLRSEHEQAGKGPLFDALKPALVGRSETQPYADLAVQLGMTEAAVKVAVHRLRDRYRQKLRQAVAQTVADPAEVDSELRHFFRVLARG